MTIPMPPEDPRRGNPNLPSTWIGLGGLTIIIVVIGTITFWNRGGTGPPAASPTTTSIGPTTPASASAGDPTDIVYRIIFDGSGSAQNDRPNEGQAYRSTEDSVTWHLEYTLGDGHSGLPDPTTSTVSGTGESKNWTDAGSCTASHVSFDPMHSALRAEGGTSYAIVSPINGGVSSTDCIGTPFLDPLYGAWGAPYCGADGECQGDEDFWAATFSIPAGQTGSHTTIIESRSYAFTADEIPGPAARNAHATWSGTVTVVAQ